MFSSTDIQGVRILKNRLTSNEIFMIPHHISKMEFKGIKLKDKSIVRNWEIRVVNSDKGHLTNDIWN